MLVVFQEEALEDMSGTIIELVREKTPYWDLECRSIVTTRVSF